MTYLPSLSLARRAASPGLAAALCLLAAPLAAAPIQDPQDVPVTIKELDVEGAIREFKSFQEQLGRFQQEISAGRSIAKETSQILEDLRSTATTENGFNEEPILGAVGNYVDGVLAKQVELVDFLESQRYRISYYASKMASSVRPEELAVLFGTEQQNDAAIGHHVQRLADSQQAVATFVDGLPDEWIDRASFRPSSVMPQDKRKELDVLLFKYQQERNGLELAKKRLQLVRAAKRNAPGASSEGLEIDSDLLVGQMFGALDRIRLQMSMDLIFLEQLLEGFARSARTHDILEAFQSLVEMQGDLEGPSPELSSVLDWLQDSSIRRLSLGVSGLERPGLSLPRYSDLLREAYVGARGGE